MWEQLKRRLRLKNRLKNWNLDVDDKQQYSSARKVQSQRKLIKLEQNWKRLFKWIQRSSSDLWHWIQKMENESPMRLGFRKRIHFSAAADIVVSSQLQLPRWQVQSRGSWRRSSAGTATPRRTCWSALAAGELATAVLSARLRTGRGMADGARGRKDWGRYTNNNMITFN